MKSQNCGNYENQIDIRAQPLPTLHSYCARSADSRSQPRVRAVPNASHKSLDLDSLNFIFGLEFNNNSVLLLKSSIRAIVIESSISKSVLIFENIIHK